MDMYLYYEMLCLVPDIALGALWASLWRILLLWRAFCFGVLFFSCRILEVWGWDLRLVRGEKSNEPIHFFSLGLKTNLLL